MDSAQLLEIGAWLNAHVFGAQSDFAREVGLFVVTAITALATQVLFWDVDPARVADRLRPMIPDKSRFAVVIPILILLSIAVGAFIGFIVYDPQDVRQATIAGVGWYTAVRSIRRPDDPAAPRPEAAMGAGGQAIGGEKQ
jgi:hypothetical protein